MTYAKYYASAEPYQLRCRDFLLDNASAAVWADPGLRKTGITLSAIVDLLRWREVSRVLVVAPLHVVLGVWPEEIRKWREFQHLTHTTVRGETSWRMSLTARETDVHLINYELLDWLVEFRARTWPYDMIVFDESDLLKSPSSVRWRQCTRLLHYLEAHNKRPRIVQLTGTPAPQGLHDTWAQVYLLDSGLALGTEYHAFLERWFTRDGYRLFPRAHAAREIQERVAPLAVSLSKVDYLRLPPVVVNTVPVALPPRAREQYDSMERDAFLALAESVGEAADALEGGREVNAFGAAAKVSKCLQVASGAVYLTTETGQPSHEWAHVHDAKLDALRTLVHESRGQPVLVVYWYRHDRERILHAFRDARVLTDDQEYVNAWNTRRLPVALLSAAKGQGLNLQDGGHTIVWFSPVWSLRLWLQTIGRLHRSGQDKPVIVHQLIAQGTLDEDVPVRLADKASTQELLLARMRMVLSKSEAA